MNKKIGRLNASRCVGYKPKSRRGLASTALLCLLSLLSMAFGPPEITESDQPQTPFFGYQLAQMVADTPPALAARAFVALDGVSGKVVAEQSSHLRLAPASTTKIMTAIVALEKGRLSDKITVKAEHLQPLDGTGSSVMGLEPGDIFTLEDLLWGLLLPSGNDAAVVIASTVGGSVPGFVRMMNAQASDLGLKDTLFANPHGLDAEGHYTSAYDLATMARYALKNPTFRRMVASPTHTINGSRIFHLANSNGLLARADLYPGVDGVKTGTTDNAGECLVASASRDGRSMIAVVMNSPSRDMEAGTLIDFAFDRLDWVSLPSPAFASLVDGQGLTWTLTLSPTVETVSPWEKQRLSLGMRHEAAAPGPTAAIRHIAVYRLGDRIIEVPLQATSP